MADLFSQAKSRKPRGKAKAGYSAKDIEVLEGLEPVRRRPGMYIGGTDLTAMHHLAAEVLDNAMDEAVAGEASRIELTLEPGNWVTVRDNGRGIPVDPHPKFKNKSALEVILTTLHSGGKFSSNAYETSGGLHGVGLSVVNALADELTAEVARDGKLWVQAYARGKPVTKLKSSGGAKNRRGTVIRFHPDPEIFCENESFDAARLYRMARAKAHLYRGVEIHWKADPALIGAKDDTPEKAVLHFPGGLADFVTEALGERKSFTPAHFIGEAAYGELTGNRKAAQITADDVMDGVLGAVSVFIRDPQFQGQTKEKLSNPSVVRMMETVIKDHFDHWLSGDPSTANLLLDAINERVDERLARRRDREQKRKSATRKLRLPGKLADCSAATTEGTEIFLVEGDSAGGSAKQARNRSTQAVLPLRGKILNVATATAEKMHANQEITDLLPARHHHDRCRCRRGPYRLSPDHLLLPGNAEIDRCRAAVSRGAAALPAEPGRRRDLCPRRRP
jgi:topoisomerase-4 subunit B